MNLYHVITALQTASSVRVYWSLRSNAFMRENSYETAMMTSSSVILQQKVPGAGTGDSDYCAPCGARMAIGWGGVMMVYSCHMLSSSCLSKYALAAEQGAEFGRACRSRQVQ